MQNTVLFGNYPKWLNIGVILLLSIAVMLTLRFFASRPSAVFATQDSVTALALHPNGEIIASSETNNNIFLRAISDGHVIRTLVGHTETLQSLAFSPDGQMIVSGSADTTVRLWRVQNGQLLNTLEGHTDGVTGIAFSPDGQTVASGSSDTTIKIWRVSDGSLVKTLRGHKDRVISVAFSPNGQVLASSSQDGNIRLWRTDNGNTLTSLLNIPVRHNITFSLDSQTLIAGGQDHKIWMLHVPEGQVSKTLEGHSSEVVSIAISPDKHTLASASGLPGTFEGPPRDTTIKLWDINTGKLLRTISAHDDVIYGLTFSSNGQFLVSGSADKTIKLWRVQ